MCLGRSPNIRQGYPWRIIQQAISRWAPKWLPSSTTPFLRGIRLVEPLAALDAEDAAELLVAPAVDQQVAGPRADLVGRQLRADEPRHPSRSPK